MGGRGDGRKRRWKGEKIIDEGWWMGVRGLSVRISVDHEDVCWYVKMCVDREGGGSPEVARCLCC